MVDFGRGSYAVAGGMDDADNMINELNVEGWDNRMRNANRYTLMLASARLDAGYPCTAANLIFQRV